MKHVRLTISAPPGSVHPVFDLLTGSDAVETVRGLDWNVSDDRLGILHYLEGDPEAYVAELESIPSVLAHDVARAGDGSFYVYHKCVLDRGARRLFEAFTSGSLLLVPPIEFGSDGSSTLSLFGESAEIQAAVEAVPDPVEVTIEEVGGMSGTPEVTAATLSDRQRAAVEAGLELGYYEVPREASHEEVAAAIDCAPSTAAEHLRKAEARVLRAVLGE